MVYESLIAIVESHLDNLTDTWVQEVKRSQYLDTYKKLTDSELSKRGNILFSNLLDWLLKGASNDDAAKYFLEIGDKRFKEGFPLTEVYYALYLEKKVLWSFVAWKDEVSGILKALDAIEFMTVINNYFDLGDFYIIKGYNEQLFIQLKETGKFTSEELENIFAGGAFYQESIKKIKEQMYGEGLSIGIIR
ncbi:MAG: RsbRD N-terminal domain-containing protein [Ignavibacteriales bacterium]|nr:RsbRD N-terminal domain-containing protein [Ignavibacteriales bacterium]MCB9257763.1 RsbRD N-terminal domain-containing protein [Ignavibacteriales bacterium]